MNSIRISIVIQSNPHGIRHVCLRARGGGHLRAVRLSEEIMKGALHLTRATGPGHTTGHILRRDLKPESSHE